MRLIPNPGCTITRLKRNAAGPTGRSRSRRLLLSRVRGWLQEREAAEQAARALEDRLGGQCGQLMAEVWFEERAEADSPALESVERLAEGALAGHAADDDVRVLLPGVKEDPGRLGHGMAGLDELLGGGEILADQHVEVRDLRHQRCTSRGMLYRSILRSLADESKRQDGSMAHGDFGLPLRDGGFLGGRRPFSRSHSSAHSRSVPISGGSGSAA